ncbi:hypothetical protein [Pseudonocardia sp.]|uniref:hypothetical protein n=1 Tax=Pseudonocardia sp. TaxID=60912 RepID=UPI0026127497|nr:hypothetical protein [Pseudonocardia sp.]
MIRRPRVVGGELTLFADYNELVRLWDALADATVELELARMGTTRPGPGSAA